MKTYRTLTLQEIIDALRALPADAEVVGIDGVLHSDRGYYERSASEPAGYPINAALLAKHLQEQIGKPTFGWKGGDYTVRADLPVHIGEYGVTGPSIAGVEQVGDHYEFVTIEDSWF